MISPLSGCLGSSSERFRRHKNNNYERSGRNTNMNIPTFQWNSRNRSPDYVTRVKKKGNKKIRNPPWFWYTPPSLGLEHGYVRIYVVGYVMFFFLLNEHITTVPSTCFVLHRTHGPTDDVHVKLLRLEKAFENPPFARNWPSRKKGERRSRTATANLERHSHRGRNTAIPFRGKKRGFQ